MVKQTWTETLATDTSTKDTLTRIGIGVGVPVLFLIILLILVWSIAAHHKIRRKIMDEENKKNKTNERIKIQDFKDSKIKTTSIFKTQNNETVIRGKLKETSIETSFSMLVEYHSYEEVLEIYGLNLETDNNKGGK